MAAARTVTISACFLLSRVPQLFYPYWRHDSSSFFSSSSSSPSFGSHIYTYSTNKTQHCDFYFFFSSFISSVAFFFFTLTNTYVYVYIHLYIFCLCLTFTDLSLYHVSVFDCPILRPRVYIFDVYDEQQLNVTTNNWR